MLRHTDNARYRRVLHALDPQLVSHPLVQEIGGVDPFEVGLYGCSEMLNEGFRRLVQTGVIRRKVHDDLALMQRIENGSTLSIDHATLAAEGEYLHGAFYLGSPEFYEWLRTLPEDECRAIGMRRISEINQLYGGNEALERLQRRHARFFNSCMMATALGARRYRMRWTMDAWCRAWAASTTSWRWHMPCRKRAQRADVPCRTR